MPLPPVTLARDIVVAHGGFPPVVVFSVRFMRIGIERLWSARLRASLGEDASMLKGLVRGTALGFVMQGATVVMLMAAGLAGAGAVLVSAATIVALGADLGSALAVVFLQLPVSALGPLAILIGASLYLNGPEPRLRNSGRILLGLGLVFLSLSIIRATVEPIGSAPFTTAVAEYLKRLGTDYIDLYWMHIWDGVTPVEEIVQTLGDLVRVGKIRYFGFSDMPAWVAMQAATIASERRVPGPIALQLEYSLVARDVEGEHLPVAREAGMGVMPWSPLAGGFLRSDAARTR